MELAVLSHIAKNRLNHEKPVFNQLPKWHTHTLEVDIGSGDSNWNKIEANGVTEIKLKKFNLTHNYLIVLVLAKQK